MFMKMQKKQNMTVISKNTDTIIGEGIIFENALLKGSGVIRIDGKLSGTIDIEGHIILGETGFVSGDITADSALFAGQYQGTLSIRDTLHMTASAVLSGKVETAKLIIDEGAVLNGTCSVTKFGNRSNVIFEEALEAGDALA
jgi:cytoskeletal protein CcmA (bactofilin family)